MLWNLKRNVFWLESLPIADDSATILLCGGDGHLVPVPAALLLAVSPLVRNIMAQQLPPAFSQTCISLPSLPEDFLKVSMDLLTTGEAVDTHENRKKVMQVFHMLGVDALLFSCHSESINVGQVLDGKDVNYTDKRKNLVETTPEENDAPAIQKNLLAFSKSLNSSEVSENISVTASNIKEEPVVVDHFVNYPVQTYEEVLQKCCECEYVSYDKSELKTHIQISHNKYVAVCKECDYIATSKAELFKHKKKVHIPAGRLFECGDCSWVGKNLHYVRHHAYSRGHKTKHDYEAATLAKAESLGSKAVAKYHKSLANSMKRAKKNH